MITTAEEHRLALGLVADPAAYTPTEVELRACRGVIDHRAQVRTINDDELESQGIVQEGPAKEDA